MDSVSKPNSVVTGRFWICSKYYLRKCENEPCFKSHHYWPILLFPFKGMQKSSKCIYAVTGLPINFLYFLRDGYFTLMFNDKNLITLLLWCIQTSAVKISDLSYKRINGTSTTKEAITLSCSNTVPCRNIVLEDINLQMNEGTPSTSLVNAVKGFRQDGLVIPHFWWLATYKACLFVYHRG